ncbi:hypothetical protein DBR11_20685 [Pedobacter sp. HMWF019]|uniref:YtxH domain-containing protein n=1 Tax=Pedobacter sp. HMWF019 TaxID=2056856 RepID=UPI000D38E0A2|nr:YtxH domain-containing protein [Pedobacter sp. HMWF019]PTS95760.1 hypothetical protein DBR11_20685 [Pedobacter sp. HMWF019]
MNKNSNVLIGLLIGLSAGAALGLLLKSNQRIKRQSDLSSSPSNKFAQSYNHHKQNRFRSENDEDFEDHVEHI